MKSFRKLFALFRKEKLDADMAEEMRAHLELQVAQNLARGMSADEARYAARRAFGGVEQLKERARDQRGWMWLDDFLRDVAFAVRSLRKTPVFAAVAVLSLALGIGANTAIFSLLDEVLLKSLPVHNPDELVVFRYRGRIEANAPRAMNGNGESSDFDPVTKTSAVNSFSRLMFDRFREDGAAFLDVFAFTPASRLNIVAAGQAEVVPLGVVVSGNYFSGLGVTPLIGRMLAPSDDDPAAPPAAVVSYSYWRRRFGDEPAVGKIIRVNDVSVAVVGVAPRAFRGTLQVGEAPDLYLPLALRPQLFPNRWNPHGESVAWFGYRIMGRLKPGVTLDQARAHLETGFHDAALAVDGRSLAEPRPRHLKPGDPTPPLPALLLSSGAQGLNEARRTYQGALFILTGIAALVLAIACVNVANLLLARAAARRRELAVRLALGASRGRLIRQLLTESLLLAFAGAALGVIFALWGQDALLALRPMGGRSLDFDLSPDWRVLGFATAAAIATGILFGVVPAVRATRVDLNTEFQGGSRGSSRGRSRFAQGLMVVQVALSVMLLVGAALFVRTLQNLQAIDVGFDRTRLLLFRVDATAGGRKATEAAEFYRQLNERLAALPGVTASTYSRFALLNRENGRSGGSFPGVRSARGAKSVAGNPNFVSPEFFRTFGLPLVMGRGIEARDLVPGAPPVFVANQAFVREFFGDRNPVGQPTSFGEVVGVVRDAAPEDLRSGVDWAVYMPFRIESVFGGQASFALRTAGDPLAMIAAVRRVAHELDPHLPLSDVRSQEEQVGRLLQQERMFAGLSSVFGLLALSLVCVGLYGLMSYAVLQRTSEIGIRLALGALPRRILGMIVRESLGLVALGAVAGALGAAAVTRLVAGLLYGLSPLDPTVYGGVTFLLAIVALLACWQPARRAAKTDPMVTLRCE